MNATRPASRTDFEIAILCALPKEAEAVRQLFDRDWDDDNQPYDKVPGDSNAYSTGRIGRHDVVVAHMPNMGTNAAAVVASNCNHSFPNVRLALVVGICGAVPFVRGGKTEVILGDVIISTGVVQFDFGRQLPEHFVRKDTLVDSLGRPITEIGTLLAKLDTLQERKKLRHKLEGHLQELQKEDELEAEYPGASQDRLFGPEYRHLVDGQACEECACDGELVKRRRLEEEKPLPAVHFGLMASGNTVMKSGQKRDEIARREGIIGFEMESAGMLDVFPCVVIKGACDYADSHKTKDWQRYAAATAAACAKAFLEYWVPSTPRLDGQSQKPSTAKHVIPYTRNPDFIGRSGVLSSIKDQLGYPRQTSWSSQARVSLHGLGGTGKTQIALAYAFWLQDTCPDVSIFWVHASSAARFQQAFAAIAREGQVPGHDDPEADILQLVKQWLARKEHGDWLMVVDNADDAQVFHHTGTGAGTGAGGGVAETQVATNLSQYLPECAHGSILITTRNKQVGVRLTKGQQPIEVLRMDAAESEELLRVKLKNLSLATDELLALSSQLEHLPLALAQAAAFIEQNTIGAGEYLELLGNSDQDTVEMLSEEFDTIGQDSEAPRAVAQTWIVSFKQIKRQHVLASDLLSLMSLLDRQDIPYEFISYYSAQEQWGGPRTKLDVTKALGTLKAFSFVAEEKSGSFNMHRLVQLVTRKWLVSCGTMDRFSSEALMTVSEMYPYGTYETRGTCMTYLSHANSVLTLPRLESREEKEAIGVLMQCMGGYFLFEGMWRNAEAAFSEAVKIHEGLFGAYHPETLASMTMLASTYWSQGRWEEAERLEVELMESHKMKLGADHPDTLICMGNLASTFQSQGRWEEAERLEVEVMEARKMKLGADHPDTLMSIANLASTFESQGRWEEAERLDMEVIEIRKIKLGADHPDTLMSMANLASIYWNQGRWEESERLEVEVLEARKMRLGADHPDTLTSMNGLANTWKHQDRLEEAERLEVEVLEARKMRLGADHPDTLISMNNLAETWRHQGRLEEAERLNVEVVESRKIKLGADHPDTLISMANLASIYWNQGRREETERLEIEVMEARKMRLGADHPDTLMSINNLAETWRHQGRLEEAERLNMEVLEARKMRLGADHPDTLTSMNNLADVWRHQGRLEAAERLNVEVIQSRKIKLGADDPDTLLSMACLASTYWEQGRLEEAERLEVEVLEARKIRLGADHPDTLISMNNLADTWRGQGRLQEALELMNNCVRRQRQVLGEAHPDTISSISTLEDWQAETP